MTTHRKKKPESRNSVSQQKPRTLPTLPHDVSPAHLEQGEALERALRERAALPPAVDSIPGLTGNEFQPSPEHLPTGSRAQTENSSAHASKSGTPIDSQLPLQAFHTHFFCDSRTQIAAAAVSEQSLHPSAWSRKRVFVRIPRHSVLMQRAQNCGMDWIPDWGHCGRSC